MDRVSKPRLAMGWVAAILLLAMVVGAGIWFFFAGQSRPQKITFVVSSEKMQLLRVVEVPGTLNRRRGGGQLIEFGADGTARVSSLAVLSLFVPKRAELIDGRGLCIDEQEPSPNETCLRQLGVYGNGAVVFYVLGDAQFADRADQYLRDNTKYQYDDSAVIPLPAQLP